MRNVRIALICLVPGLVLGLSWLRLQQPQTDGGRMLLLLALAVAPVLAPRGWQRLALLAVATVAALALAAQVPLLHPWRAGPRLWDGVLDGYDVRLPFDPVFHSHFHALLLFAGFAFAAGVALAASFERPLAAVAVFIVGATWPATLLLNGRDLLRGAIILAVSLFLLAALRENPLRTVGRAALLGGALVAAALAAATQPAVAKSEFLHWQTWKPISRPPESVSVQYVWNASYDGFTRPRKTTTVFKAQASPRSVYWRSTTLDVFDGSRWVEFRTPERALLFSGHLDLTEKDPLATAAMRNPSNWSKAQFEIEGLEDDHVVAPSVPVGYEAVFPGASFFMGGSSAVPGALLRGQRYTTWSYSPQPTSAQLAAAGTDYSASVDSYLEVYPGLDVPPPFGTPGRAATMRRFMAAYPNYAPLYAQARRVVGNAQSPYAAVLALESWLRGTGGFTYTTHPPIVQNGPLQEFVLRTKRGYCQHFAGAMTLMLRYLGIPARVAEGFTSGVYDPQSKTWTVTDHDAHAWVEVWFPHYGWLPFDPTPGRGSLSAAYTVSSPNFRTATAARYISGVAASLLNTAAIHQDLSFGEKSPGLIFGGTDIRPARPSSGPFGIQKHGGSLGRLLLLVLALAIALLALVKAVRRHWRYATPDPRRQAAACRAELRDFLADQRIRVAPSAAPDELAALLRQELEVDATRFTAALAEARFAPLPDAEAAAGRAREELTRLRALLRRRLGIVRRVRGLVSLRSLGFA